MADGRNLARGGVVVVLGALLTVAIGSAASADIPPPHPCVKTGHVEVGNPLNGELYVSQDGEAGVYVRCP